MIAASNIECFNIDTYLVFLIAIQFVSSFFVASCIIYMIVARRKRFRLIKKAAEELEKRLRLKKTPFPYRIQDDE